MYHSVPVGEISSSNRSMHKNQFNLLSLNTFCHQKILHRIVQRFIVDQSKSSPDTPVTSNWAIRRESSARSRATSGRTNCPRLSLFRCTSPFPTSFSTRLAAVYRRLGRLFEQLTRVAGAHDMEDGSDEHLQMFNIDDSANETMSECVGGIYPTDTSRETVDNYELGECIDEKWRPISVARILTRTRTFSTWTHPARRWAGNKNQLVTLRLVT
ncbi:uncharacterized protein LOC120427586 isoform X1 [Culex pipiens pallens]|uniref:uncharacterized protein LOC120427586 isoform X1 n=1 Tax=Culex pipiens pallens TaxID=42434 RepID=UPI0022AB0D30|nr:uncharacterized protein LOC120427586 isoform X1 [Culex pipiens pallens]